MDAATNPSLSEKNPSSHGSDPKEILSVLLAAVISSKQPSARELVTQLQARVGRSAFENLQPTIEKIAYLLDGQTVSPAALRAFTGILVQGAEQAQETQVLVFQSIQKLVGRQPSEQEWRILEAYCQREFPSLDFIEDRRNAWLVGELHKKLSGDFGRKIGAVPAVLALVRLSGLVHPERISDAAELLISRARTAAWPLDVEFYGSDVLALAQGATMTGDPDEVPKHHRDRITQIFQGMVGRSISYEMTEHGLQRMAIALRCAASLAPLYQANGWDLEVPVSQIGEVLTLPHLKPRAAFLYEAIIEQLVYQKKRVDKLLPVVSHIARDGSSSEQVQQFLAVMETFKPDAFDRVSGIPPWIYPYFIQAHKPQILHDFVRIALHMSEADVTKPSFLQISGHPRVIAAYLGTLTELNASPIILTGLRKEIERGMQPGPAELERIIRHLVSHAALAKLVSAGTPEEHRSAGETLNNVYVNDSPPFPYQYGRIDPRAQNFLNETFRVIRRSLDQMNGFGAHEFESRRATAETRSAMEQFLRASGGEVLRLNSSSNEKFPGAGFVVSGIDPARFLRADPRVPGEPFWQYKTMWPWVGGVIADLKDSTFITSRGMQAVIPPATRRYGLHARHYSYVVFNAHFDNTEQHGALLVPTRLLLRQLQGGLIPITEFAGYSPERRDICDGALSARAFLELGERAAVPVLNLSWPSNVAGLMRAYPPNRPPYHAWESSQTNSYRDIAGHMHHSFILGRYSASLSDPAVASRLAPLIEAHGRVRDLAEHMQALFTLFHYAEAAFSKGQYVEVGQDESQPTDADDEIEQGTPSQNYHAARQIRQSLAWHRRGEVGKFTRESFPVLAIVPTAQFCPAPEKIVPLIDTVDFSTVVDGKRRYLLREIDAERDAWEQLSDHELSHLVLKKLVVLHPQVGEVFERMGKRLRLLHRNLVYQSRNPEGGDRHAQSSSSAD